MSLNFPELIIWLLPGFLGLFVFKRIVQEDIDKRGESTQIAIALLFGLFSVGLLHLFHWGFIVLSAKSEIFSMLAKYVSPQELSSLGKGFSFWTSYTVLCFLSMLSGMLLAIFREKKYWFHFTSLFTRGGAKILGRYIQEACESSLRATVDRIKSAGNEPFLVKVYKLETYNNGNCTPLIGHWMGYSETEKEIELANIELCDMRFMTEGLQTFLNNCPRCCWINHVSGVVIEFIETTPEENKRIDQILSREYNARISC